MSEPIKLLCRHCRSKLDLSDMEPLSQVPCPVCGTLLRVPKRFGSYLLEKICGVGGMSNVYRAIDPVNRRRVAVKVMNDEAAAEDPEGRLYAGEYELLRDLSHPGFIPIYDHGVCEGRAFLVMMYMDDGTMEDRIREHTVPTIGTICDWVANVAAGLQAAQALNIVHHDLKPGNILLNSTDSAKLGDFDLADLRQRGDIRQLESSEEFWGSPGYISPERVEYGGEDYRGDIFSLGATLYEMLTYQLPFGFSNDAAELLKRRREMKFEAPEKINPAANGKISVLLKAMLSFNPDDRPEYDEIVNILNQLALE